MTLAGLLAANGATSTMPLRTGQAIVVPAASIHTAATARTGTTYSGPMPVSAQGPRVTVVGDSSALGSTSLMNLEMPGITVDAKEDRTFAEGLTRLGQLKAAGRLRDNVVLGLGVNTGGATAAQARQAMDLVGPDRELVLVTASGPVAWKAFTEQAMRDLAARYPGRVAVADWEAASRYVTDFRADRIHPRAQGLSVDAQLVRLAVGRATGGLTVTVQAGQTLSGIAVAYAVPGGWSAISRATGVPLAQLPSLNGATLSTVLHPGQALRIRLPLTSPPHPVHPTQYARPMKIGLRKPSLKKSIKARTTGRAKRAIKRKVIPGYGRKGMGWLRDPKRAAYNAVYRRTTVGLGDVLKMFK